MKFNIGDVWADRTDCPYLIIKIQTGNFPIIAQDLKSDSMLTFTSEGYEVNRKVNSPQDLVTYLGTKKDFPEYTL